MCNKYYTNTVLNCSMLLFIPEIDNQLPRILGYWEDDIIEHYLIREDGGPEVGLTFAMANHKECIIRHQCYRGIVFLFQALLFTNFHVHVGGRVIQER